MCITDFCISMFEVNLVNKWANSYERRKYNVVQPLQSNSLKELLVVFCKVFSVRGLFKCLFLY
jgi:hypothetical protein